mmetsp:Transcript_23802/g.39144  ORF Transcript_23802/g.39144 Transcript_23802/m.39144 type:complete len:345 (+) Transcript_23802:522-1556(+)
MSVLRHPECEKFFHDGESHKHLMQHSSIVANLDQASLLDPSRVYVEFGAGKGGLSHFVRQAYGGSTLGRHILVDRGSFRFKADRHNRDAALWLRLTTDIRDLDLSEVPNLKEDGTQLVSVSKHLCGCASDYAIRCIRRFAELRNSDSAVVIATCCHHICDWTSYTNRDFFVQLGFSKREFDLLCAMTSWAVCGTRANKNKGQMTGHGMGHGSKGETCEEKAKNSHQWEDGKPDKMSSSSRSGCSDAKGGVQRDLNGPIKSGASGERTNGVEGQRVPVPDKGELSHLKKLSHDEREAIGFQCKRLIDYGRLKGLESRGWDARLVTYVEREISPENVLLIAKFRTK